MAEIENIYRSDRVYPWRNLVNVLTLSIGQNVRLIDPEQEILVPTHVAAHVLPVDVMATAELENIGPVGLWDLRNHIIILRFHTPVLGPWMESLRETENIPTVRIYYVTLDETQFQHRYFGKPESMLEFSLQSILLNSMTGQLEPVYPLTVEFDRIPGHPKVNFPEYMFGLETSTVVCNNLESQGAIYNALGGHCRWKSTIQVLDANEDRFGQTAAHPQFEEWNQRFREFLGFSVEQTTRFVHNLYHELGVTGSAMAYTGHGGDLATYADADIDIFYRLKFGSNPETQTDPGMRLSIGRLFRAMGWNEGELIEIGLNRYQFRIPEGRKIDFYRSGPIRVWGHHVAPARMFRDHRGFRVSPSAMFAYETGIIGDLRYVFSSTQSAESIRDKYVARGFQVGPVMARFNPEMSVAASSAPIIPE